MMLEYRCNDYESLNMLFRAEPYYKNNTFNCLHSNAYEFLHYLSTSRWIPYSYTKAVAVKCFTSRLRTEEAIHIIYWCMAFECPGTGYLYFTDKCVSVDDMVRFIRSRVVQGVWENSITPPLVHCTRIDGIENYINVQCS